MEREFNTTGPCFADEHYMLPPERRLTAVLDLIARNKYFVFHAGRQTGKTTSLMWLEAHLPALGKRAIRIDLQTARDEPDPRAAFPIVMSELVARPRDGIRAATPEQIAGWLATPSTAIQRYIEFLAGQDPRPLVLLVDEADCLVGETMVSFLTQLRAGYIARREAPFPSSIALVGMREVRDFVLERRESETVSWLGTASPFNVSAESAELDPFTEADIAELLGQHTRDTGQPFDPGAIHRVWELTRGHPWLVNALADEAVRKQVRDRTAAVTAASIDAAKETIIRERRSHVDSLVARLREPRVAGVLAPILAGTQAGADVLDDDFAYVVAMGILRREAGEYRIANPIYREIIPRALTFTRQHQIHQPTERFILPDGSLNLPKLFVEWQKFWRKDGHLAAEGFHYREAGPHLMLMAFLQRIVNGGGRVEREYGLGRGALDLLVEWKGARHAIEVKIRRDTETEEEALEQIGRNLDSAGLAEGWLVLFDLRREVPWTAKHTLRDEQREGKTIHVIGS